MLTLSNLLAIAGADVIHALADDDRDGTADDAVIADAIASAIREVEAETSRAGVFYDDGDPLLEDLAATLAVARLFERRREPLPPHWQDRATRARATARMIGDGRHPLAFAQSEATHASDDRTFDIESLKAL